MIIHRLIYSNFSILSFSSESLLNFIDKSVRDFVHFRNAKLYLDKFYPYHSQMCPSFIFNLTNLEHGSKFWKSNLIRLASELKRQMTKPYLHLCASIMNEFLIIMNHFIIMNHLIILLLKGLIEAKLVEGYRPSISPVWQLSDQAGEIKQKASGRRPWKRTWSKCMINKDGKKWILYSVMVSEMPSLHSFSIV